MSLYNDYEISLQVLKAVSATSEFDQTTNKHSQT